MNSLVSRAERGSDYSSRFSVIELESRHPTLELGMLAKSLISNYIGGHFVNFFNVF